MSGNCRKKGLDKGREGKEEPNLGTGRGEVDECGEVEITKKRLDKEEKNPKTYIDFLVRHVARQRNGRVYRGRRRVRIGGGNSCPSAPLVIWLERESAGVAGRHGSGRLIRGSGDGVIALLLRSSKAKARTNPAEAAGEGVHHVRRGWKTGKAGKAPRVFQDQTQGTGLLAAFDGDGGGEGGLGVRTRHYSVYKAVFRGMEEVAAGGFNLGFVIRHRELPPTDTRPDALTHTTTTHIHGRTHTPQRHTYTSRISSRGQRQGSFACRSSVHLILPRPYAPLSCSSAAPDLAQHISPKPGAPILPPPQADDKLRQQSFRGPLYARPE